MKKLILAVAFLSSLMSLNAQVDLKINPLGALFVSPDLSAEFAITENIGLDASIGYIGQGLKVAGTKYKRSGMTYGAIGKYYFNPENPTTKFYGGLYFNGGNIDWTSNTDSTSNILNQKKLGIGLALGYKWVSSQNVVFEITGGLGRKATNRFTIEQGSADLRSFPFLKLDGLLRINVGYRFGGGSSSRR